jgi:long-chain acyl-CoA synthetase
VVKFVLLPEPFSIDAGTMTNTLKLRRSSIEKMYKHLVDKLYES